MRLSNEERRFLAARPETEALYAALREGLENRLGACEAEVHRTQISLKQRYGFAAVSFAPVRRTDRLPESFLTLSFSLKQALDSPRIAAAVEISSQRWLHQIMLTRVQDVDQELLDWLVEAARLAEVKR